MPLREDWTDNQELVAADHIEAHNALAAAANAGGGDPQALHASSPFTVVQMPDPVAGTGTMDVIVFPAATSARLALAAEGAAFPWMVMGADWEDGVYFGDGTYDPYNDGGANLYDLGTPKGVGLIGELHVRGDVAVAQGSDYRVADKASGVVLLSPDNTAYRIKVANDGTLSTEPAV